MVQVHGVSPKGTPEAQEKIQEPGGTHTSNLNTTLELNRTCFSPCSRKKNRGIAREREAALNHRPEGEKGDRNRHTSLKRGTAGGNKGASRHAGKAEGPSRS